MMSEIFKITLIKQLRFALELCDSFHTILQNGTLKQLQQFLISEGKNTVPFSEFFQIEKQSSGENNPEREVHWEGDFSRVHGIGRAWAAGKMQVIGSVGDCLGERMTGGEISVTENTGDAVGSSMSGGKIVIAGDAGDRVGSPAPGELRGMTGGEIFIGGNAGKFLGMRMRRGTIVVQKDVEKNAGKEMLAGSILLLGNHCGQPGIGMKRGTIVLFQQADEAVLQTLGTHCDPAVTYQPVFLNALLRHIEKTGAVSVDQSLYESWYRRYSCDKSEGSRGEILVQETPAI